MPIDVILTVALYFAAAALGLALLVLPPFRDWFFQQCRDLAGRGRAWRLGLRRSGGQAAAQVAHGAASLRADAWSVGRRHGRWLLVGLAVVAGLPLAVLALRGHVRVDGFDHTASRALDERVAALLHGEALVPPPPLPPELFMTREVEAARPDARFLNREWGLLDDEFRRRLLVVFRLLREQHGYEAVLLEGYRSPQRQASLAAAGPQVTLAGAFQSYHQFGLAADVAFLRNGRIALSEKDEWVMRGYEAYGEIARSLGLTWGGGWRSIRDFGHVELRRPGVLARRGENGEPPQAAGH